jgi:hypothetical protein
METVDRHDTNTYRHLPRRVHDAICRDIVRPACFSEELDERDSDAAERHRVDSPPADRSGAASQRTVELAMKKEGRIPFEESTPNVFADLDLAHPEQELEAERVRRAPDG